jgi:hypothetical protein
MSSANGVIGVMCTKSELRGVLEKDGAPAEKEARQRVNGETGRSAIRCCLLTSSRVLASSQLLRSLPVRQF